MSKKISISYSSASRYKQCPRKYYHSKQFKTVSEGSALSFGKAFELAVEALLYKKPLDEALVLFEQSWSEVPDRDGTKQVLDNTDIEYYASDFESDLITDVQSAYIDSFAKELGYTEFYMDVFSNIKDKIRGTDFKDLPEKEKLLYNRVMWECCLSRGKVMLIAFNNKVLSNITEVVATQRKVSIENDEGDENVGYVDLIAKYKGYDAPVIFDLKTSARSYTDHELLTTEQLRNYSAILAEELKSNLIGYIVIKKKIQTKKLCDNCGHVRLRAAKKCTDCKKGEYTRLELDTDVQVMIRSVEDRELDDVLDSLSGVLKSIKHKIDYKNPEACNNYGKLCEFYDVCWKNKKPESIKHLIKKEDK